MANTIQARKRARQAEVRRERNVSQKSKLRTFVKNVEKLVDAKEKAYDLVKKINWPDYYYRKDIGWRALKD